MQARMKMYSGVDVPIILKKDHRDIALTGWPVEVNLAWGVSKGRGGGYASFGIY